jgi:Spy/CpxP family protein refolding chaperone
MATEDHDAVTTTLRVGVFLGSALLLGVVTVFGITRVARPGGCGDVRAAPGFGYGGKYPLFELLELTKAQRQIWNAARQAHVATVRPSIERLRDLRSQLSAELAGGSADAPAVGRYVIAIHECEETLAAARAELDAALIDVLTDEQAAKYAAIEAAYRAADSSALSATLSALPLAAAVDAAVPDFSGKWVLNEEASDDVLEKMEEARRERQQGGFGGGSGRGGGRGGDGGLFPPGALPPRRGGGSPEGGGREGRSGGRTVGVAQGVLSALMAPAMVIEQEGDRIVVKPEGAPPESERTFTAGAGKVEDVLEGEVRRSVVAIWKDGTLMVKTKLHREMGSTQSTETWRLSDHDSRLFVELETSGGPLKGIEIRRVYDRATSSAPPVESSQHSSSAPTDGLER